MAQFNQAISQTEALLAGGDIELARVALDRAWSLAGQVKARRTKAHDLGNMIQRAIFEAYIG